mmetsp:Transcript_18952/g.28604  ORF Transcript_18952/g.28604 Transcript_18952/m.28604 type:complete len:362 (+) Transcript_18952:82-1167(+)
MSLMSGRPQRRRIIRQPYGSENLLCELVDHKLRKKTSEKKRVFGEDTIWKIYEKRLDGLIHKAVGFKFILETLAHDGDDNQRRVRPEAEILSAKQKYRATKEEIRKVLEEIDTIDNEIRWGNPDMNNDDNGSIDVENVACSKCGGMICDDHNDIVMCDRKNCYRAYHMNCCDPRLDLEQIGDPDDDWFCHLCETMERAINKINELFDKNYSDPDQWTRVFLDDDSDINVLPKSICQDSILALDLDEYHDSDDSDFSISQEKKNQQQQTSDSSMKRENANNHSSDDSDEYDDLSMASGDDPHILEHLLASDKRAIVEDVDERNIISGPRKRSRVDYVVLNYALLSQGELEVSSSEDGEWSSL